jgi:phenylacetaldehyde dehydrogenase
MSVAKTAAVLPGAATIAFLTGAHDLLIGGSWVRGGGERVIDVENPATGEVIAHVPAASEQDVDAAVAAARAALSGPWARMSGRERSAILLRTADLIEARADRIAEIMTLDNGMPLASSRQVVTLLGAELFRYYAGWASKISGDAFAPSIGRRDLIAMTLREPVGVVGAIVPWNAPAGMIALKVAPALAAGCAVVLKTAELAPLVGQTFGEILLEAGLPPGAFNLLHGFGDDVGAALAAHPGVDKIAFTGSTAVGRKILDAAKGNLKRVTLELGGKSPFIVCEDADLEAAAPAAAMACYLSSGQACMAGTRLFAHSAIHDELVERVAAFTKTLKVGDGMAPDTVLGPVISARQKARILNYIRIGEEDGASLVFGGEALSGAGHFITPALFANATQSMRIAQEEIFGPVLTVLRFDNDDAMIADVNATPYGLSGSVWTKNVQRAIRLARRVDSGQVGVNIHAAVSPETPFGGNKQSGWGREFGREGLDAYLKTKAVTFNLGDKA